MCVKEEGRKGRKEGWRVVSWEGKMVGGRKGRREGGMERERERRDFNTCSSIPLTARVSLTVSPTTEFSPFPHFRYCQRDMAGQATEALRSLLQQQQQEQEQSQQRRMHAPDAAVAAVVTCLARGQQWDEAEGEWCSE